jgi:hypothetical protein
MFYVFSLKLLVSGFGSVTVDFIITCLPSVYSSVTNKDTFSWSRTDIYDINTNMQEHS